ncbi:MAG: hypothetical protein NZ921_01490 [Candidatus Caldarchaeum sp.]|nr:hypothetical protein [Candidatus Caldarchaeum sp.]
MAEIVGGAAAPHSPVVYKLPWPEEQSYITEMEKLRESIKEIGRRMNSLKPDVLLVFGADHVQTFWFGNFPQMTLFTGEEADYAVAGNKLFRLKNDYKLSEELLEGLVDEGFDVGFMQEVDFFDHPFTVPVYWILQTWQNKDLRVIPFHVNTNVHPRVKLERCYQLGMTVKKILEKSRNSSRVFVIGTGGLSHYPGTPYYGNVDEEADLFIIDKLKQNKFRELTDLGYDWLDATGNHELGTWLAAAGAVDPRKTEVLVYWRAWNNGYAVALFER